MIARIVAELSAYGFQARHLRPVKAAVDREVGLIEQVLTPLVRQPSRDGRGRAETHARGYAALSVRLHVALLEAALRAACTDPALSRPASAATKRQHGADTGTKRQAVALLRS